MDKKEFLTLSGPVTALRGWHATPEERKQALSRQAARQIISELGDNPSRDLLTSLGTLAAGVDPAHLLQPDCAALIADLRDAVDSRQILFLEGWGIMPAGKPPSGGGDSATGLSAAQKLGQLLMGDSDEFTFENRLYRLVASPAASREAQQKGFQLAGQVESLMLLKRMATSLADTPEAKKAWAEATDLIKKGGNRGQLVLMRHAPVVVTAPRASAAPSTPSQLHPEIADEHWVEFEIVYDDGTPFEGNCVIELPGGRISEGPPGAKGIIRIDGLASSGDCKLKFPDLDAGAVSKA